MGIRRLKIFFRRGGVRAARAKNGSCGSCGNYGRGGVRVARAGNGSGGNYGSGGVRAARVENLREAWKNLEGAEFWKGRMEDEKGIKSFVL